MWQLWLLGLLVLACLAAAGYIPAPFAIVLAFGGFIGWQLLRDQARTKEIRQLAQRSGLTYLGSVQPDGVPLPEEWRPAVRTIARAVAGAKGNGELLLFDCVTGHGKSRYYRTVVAVRGQRSFFEIGKFATELATGQAGEWALIYSDSRFLTLEEIEALVTAV